MPRKPPRQRENRVGNRPAQSDRSNPVPPPPPGLARSRQRLFRLAAIVLAPLLLLLLAETGLRLVRIGYPTSFWIPHPEAGSGARVENVRFSWRFFPRTLARVPQPARIDLRKPPGTLRLVVFGESAAEGDPAPAFSFARILEVLLQDRHPGTRFEVINVAFTAINSHVVRPIARDCRHLDADFWIVYMANNEVIGPYGTGTVFGPQSPPLPLIRAGLALKSTRLGQALDTLHQRLLPSSAATAGWDGMTLFTRQQIRQDDPRLTALHRHFEQNLEDIIETGTRSGARLLVSTLVCRLRDWPPFASLNRPDLNAADRTRWDQLYQAGIAAQANHQPAHAIAHYTAAAQLDDTHAELQYRWAQCALALGNLPEAQRRFSLARDLDTLRFRTDSRLNERIRQITARWPADSVRLLDAENAFAGQSPDGIPGQEWFHEHVHFTFAGNYLLARLHAEAIADWLATGRPPPTPPPDWLNESQCAARLAYTDSQRFEIAHLIQERFAEPIYRQQTGHADRLLQVQDQLDQLRAAAKPAGRQQAIRVSRQALEARPDDWVLHDLLARLLGAAEEPAAAEAAWNQVIRLLPHAAHPHTEIGKLRIQRRQLDQAREAFQRALHLNPSHVGAHLGLARVAEQQDRRSEAIRHYRTVRRLDPARPDPGPALTRLTGRAP